jgi:hypothetical protein
MPVEESVIQLVPLPELWPPLPRAPVKPSPLEQGPALPPEPGPPLPRQFAVLLAEVLAGVRPARQVTPWLSQRGTLHLHRLMPLFQAGHQPKVLRVLTTRPAENVVEMTIIAIIGPRPRALAVRLEHGEHGEHGPLKHSAQPPRWLCTDIEAA